MSQAEQSPINGVPYTLSSIEAEIIEKFRKFDGEAKVLKAQEEPKPRGRDSYDHFWYYYDQPGKGHTVFANELIAFEAAAKMVREGLMDRAIAFDDQGIGFMEYVKVIADTIEEWLPKVFDKSDIKFLMNGRDYPERDETESTE